MLNELHSVENQIFQLLKNRKDWHSLFIDYDHPHVERLWKPFGDGFRINLHRIHPCTPQQALFHPHPWASAIRIIHGRYEMGVGFSARHKIPPVAAVVVLGKGDEYEMTHPDSWHYVRPLDEPTISLMVTGKPWNRESPKSHKTLGPLKFKQKATIFSAVEDYYKKLNKIAVIF